MRAWLALGRCLSGGCGALPGVHCRGPSMHRVFAYFHLRAELCGPTFRCSRPGLSFCIGAVFGLCAPTLLAHPVFTEPSLPKVFSFWIGPRPLPASPTPGGRLAAFSTTLGVPRLLAAVLLPLSRRAVTHFACIIFLLARHVASCAGPQAPLLPHAHPATRRRLLYIPSHCTVIPIAQATHKMSLAQCSTIMFSLTPPDWGGGLSRMLPVPQWTRLVTSLHGLRRQAPSPSLVAWCGQPAFTVGAPTAAPLSTICPCTVK